MFFRVTEAITLDAPKLPLIPRLCKAHLQEQFKCIFCLTQKANKCRGNEKSHIFVESLSQIFFQISEIMAPISLFICSRYIKEINAIQFFFKAFLFAAMFI